MAGGGEGLNGSEVVEAALDAWRDCDPDGGYVLEVKQIRACLPKIAARIPCRSKAAADLGRLFVEPPGDSAVFVQMLRPRGGQVQFLYFWKAFGEATRTAGARSLEAENLSVELEMLRDRILRRVEEAHLGLGGESELNQEFAVEALLEELTRASSMSAYPAFWQAAAESFAQPGSVLSLDDITMLCLSWLRDVCLWEHRDAPRAVPKDPGLRVLVHVYDVSQEDSIKRINKVLAHKHFPLKFGGVFHAGVEVNGMEYCFGFSASKNHPGVACVEPKTHPQHHYRQTVDMGVTPCSAGDVTEIITQMLEEYPGDDYDLLRRNCCHFADDFTRRLGVGGIPGWVMRLAKIGAGVDSMIKSAPKSFQQRIGYCDTDSD